jgi:hypothetical protein
MSRLRAGWGLTGILILSLGAQGCVRDLIHKYRDQTGRQQSTQTSGRQPTAKKQSSKPRIYAIDQQTFRFRLPYDQVWDGALNVLLRNYNLNIVDRESGVITTEWDSFYLADQVYRNKISLRMKKLAWDLVEVLVYNNVETLRNTGTGGVASTWLPTDKGAKEVGRVVQNMAIALRQPPPVLPREMIATKPEQKSRTQ